MLSWAAGMGFLGLVAEHSIAQMAQEFLASFLASLMTLLPAGLLIGVGTRMVAKPGRHVMSPEDPVVAVVLIFVLTLLLNLLPTTRSTYEKLGPFSSMAMEVRVMAAEIEMSPAVPATFWKAAEREFRRSHPGPRDTIGIAPKPKVAAPYTPSAQPHVDLQGAVARLVGPDSIASETSPALHWDRATWAEFVRSWLVILLFAIGVGYAPVVERSLRPIDYPNSETYRRDLLLSVAVMAVVVVSCFYAHAATKSAT
jgi:hypothetical protein